MKIVKDINEIFYKSTDVEQLLQKKKKKKTDVEQKAFINLNKYVLRCIVNQLL